MTQQKNGLHQQIEVYYQVLKIIFLIKYLFRFLLLAVCELEKDAGSCSKYVNMWAFDRQQGKCIRFWYGSCEGNGNRFETEQQCQETCINPKGIGKDKGKKDFLLKIFLLTFNRSLSITKNNWTLPFSSHTLLLRS